MTHSATHKINGRTRLQWIDLILHHTQGTVDRLSLRTIARPDLIALQYGLKKPRYSKRHIDRTTPNTFNAESGAA